MRERSPVHVAARGFGRTAEAYERARPSYPPAAVRQLAASCRVGPATTLVDLAAGTGKLTRLLTPRAGRVIAVEPVAGMRTVLARVVPDADVVGGTAEAIPLADQVADAVVVAQAFHWFDAGRALAEIHRILRPGGRLGVVFNIRDVTSDLQADVSRLLADYRGDTPSYWNPAWREPFADSELFGPLEEVATLGFAQRLDRGRFVDRVLSTSFLSGLPNATRRRVAGRAARLFDTYVGGGNTVALLYTTRVYCTVRRP